MKMNRTRRYQMAVGIAGEIADQLKGGDYDLFVVSHLRLPRFGRLLRRVAWVAYGLSEVGEGYDEFSAFTFGRADGDDYRHDCQEHSFATLLESARR